MELLYEVGEVVDAIIEHLASLGKFHRERLVRHFLDVRGSCQLDTRFGEGCDRSVGGWERVIEDLENVAGICAIGEGCDAIQVHLVSDCLKYRARSSTYGTPVAMSSPAGGVSEQLKSMNGVP